MKENMKHDALSLEDAINTIKSIRQVITEKGGDNIKQKTDSYFSLYCFILENSTCPHGWTPPITLIDIAGMLKKRERTIFSLLKNMVAWNLVERERVGGIYRYKLVDLEINYNDR